MHTSELTLTTPVGPLTLVAGGGGLVAIRFGAGGPTAAPDTILAQAAREFEEYFAGARTRFTVPVRFPSGASAFRLRVWETLGRIPYGAVRTYGELARTLGTSPRAVGGACRANPLPIVVPCHRVVARSGLGGYAGDWERGAAGSVKRFLLELEARASG
ncbi:methylated-DNA--[protein]-cysteine S-methyltransferase [Deferrisoma camini]|uniref:methylated-DNA--[protein]-cysteine S-methyltransferase n=1 Tax=Deferrisoma camini TaxID=1035120 RepID=UPI00046C8DBC|nr:methylated-DNA--[protein]-cysteine S-methyltransferase [Deferrisoma camini]